MRSIITSRVEPFGSSVTSRSCGRTKRVADLVRLADERHHELVGRLLVHVARRADLLDPPVAHHDDLVGDLHRLLLVVRDDHRRRVRLVVEPAQPLPQLRADAGVQGAERLVEEQHGRIDRERAGETHALPLPARELRRVPLREPVELHELQQLVDALGDLRLRALADLQAERDVVVHGHVLEGGVVLEDEADAALLRRPARDVLPVDEDARPGRRSRAPRRSAAASTCRCRSARGAP